MPLTTLDHVNIRTARLAVLTAFYEEVLGLRVGPRPPFPFGGAWLYCGDKPVVHLVAVDAPPPGSSPSGAASTSASTSASGSASSDGGLRLSHFAFAGTGLADFLERLDGAGIPHRVGTLPGAALRQVHLRDPDGNELHVDFAPDDARG